jgi:carbonic anhydrase
MMRANASASRKPANAASPQSCIIDSHVGPELVRNAAVGDLYTGRNGAAVVGDDSLGNLEISVASGARVLLVPGHARYAGVRAACSGADLGHFMQLRARVKPAISNAKAALDKAATIAAKVGKRKPKNPNHVTFVPTANTRLQAEQIAARSAIIREAVTKGAIWLVPAIYGAETGAVAFEAPIKVTSK